MGETSSLELEPLAATFGAIVHDVELRSLDDDTWQALHEAWLAYALLIVPDQFLTRDEQNALARRFGELEFPAAAISNIDRGGEVRSRPDDDVIKSLRGNEGWHIDSTYMPIQAKGAVFTAEIVPSSGGDTGWADMAAAYDALDDETRQLVEGLSAHHSLYHSQGRAGLLPTPNADGGYDQYGYHDEAVSVRPLVKVHPETGRKSLSIGRHAHDIVGMDPVESMWLLDRLDDQACRPPRIHYHHWTPGDTVIWDNRTLMHRATPFDMRQPRRMWHTRIKGDATELASNHPG